MLCIIPINWNNTETYILVQLSKNTTNTTHHSKTKSWILNQTNNDFNTFFLHLINQEIFFWEFLSKLLKSFFKFIHIFNT